MPRPAPQGRQGDPMGQIGLHSSTSLTGAVTQLLQVLSEVNQAKRNDW